MNSKNQEKKQYLNVPFEFKENGMQKDEKYFIFEGYACTYGDLDLGGDIIQKGAVELVNKPKFCYQHNMQDPIGTYINISSDENGLFIKARMRRGFDKTEWIASLIEDGAIDSMSIGYFLKDYSIDPKTRIRTLTKIQIFETSFVTMPMNPEAQLTSFKAFNAASELPIAERDIEWNSADAIQNLREYTNSVDKPSEDYRKYFMYFDATAPELFGSYKLPFCDVIDDEIYIIPRAIYAIAGILNGARGGVELPTKDRSLITTFINELYRRMADKFDDAEIISPVNQDSLELASLKDIELILREKGFSRKEAKTLISKTKEFSNQCNAGEKELNQCDAETKAKIDVESIKSELNKILNKLLN